MSEKYILNGKTPVKVDDLMEWARWFENAKRKVDDTDIAGAHVSTVFLGIDHAFRFGGDKDCAPVLFETMVFRKGKEDTDDMQRRYCTWDEAQQGHNEICDILRKELLS